MSKELQLQPRLAFLASLVPRNARIADVGTDHGYLPVYLLQQGRITAAIASDVGEEPLEHGRRTASEHGVKGIDFRLCDGLAGVAPEETDTVIIAGMGGDTMVSILTPAPWTKEGKLLLLQPMTKQEMLRKWLANNGYAIEQERLVWDKGILYPVLLVRGGTMGPLTEAEAYGGVHMEDDPLCGDYLDHQISRLHRSIEGLHRSKDNRSYEHADDLQQIVEALEERRKRL